MKCELCGWAEKPESVPSMSRHIGTYHQDIVPDHVVIWKDAEMRSIPNSDFDIEDFIIEVPVKKIVPAPKDVLIEEQPLQVETVEDFEDEVTVLDRDEEV
jgi:hypothetical protein